MLFKILLETKGIYKEGQAGALRLTEKVGVLGQRVGRESGCEGSMAGRECGSVGSDSLEHLCHSDIMLVVGNL